MTTVVAAAAQGYLADRKMNGAAPKTLVKFGPILALYADWAGDRAPGSITGAELRLEWLPTWHAAFEARNGRPPAPRTVNSMIDTLAGFYEWMMKVDLLVDADGRLVPTPWVKIDRRTFKQKLRHWLEADELAALIEAGKTPQRRFQARWLAHTGLRIEADECRVMDVNLATDTISVSISKTSAGVRSIPIHPALKPILVGHLDEMKRRGLYSPRTPILYTRNGTAVKEQQAQRQLAEMGERAGIAKEVNPQMLRRTFGSILLNKGMRIETVSRLMGHESVATTAKFYAELLPETIRAEYLRVVA
jgi:site-specific recombinase XerD